MRAHEHAPFPANPAPLTLALHPRLPRSARTEHGAEQKTQILTQALAFSNGDEPADGIIVSSYTYKGLRRKDEGARRTRSTSQNQYNGLGSQNAPQAGRISPAHRKNSHPKRAFRQVRLDVEGLDLLPVRTGAVWDFDGYQEVVVNDN